MTADARFSPKFSRKLVHLIFSLFALCGIVWPSQQQLSPC